LFIVKGKYPHASRWYRHIESFEAAGRKQFPAGSGAAPKAAAGGDDDDVDLFGSDEEDDEEAQKVKEERLQV
jgi:elongation factor 1-beta